MGNAIHDFFHTRRAEKLFVLSPDFDEDEMPVTTLFRSLREMPKLERTALKLSRGKILDVGAGSGCHALALQDAGKDVKAIDISELSVETMRERGVMNAELRDLFDDDFTEQFDTILMLMNGIGIGGTIASLPVVFEKLRSLLLPGGEILTDSSDLRYLFEEEDGSFDVDLNASYYGEMQYRMRYKDIVGDMFPWLYVDFQTLSFHAAQAGFKTELLEEGNHYDYLAKLTL